MQFYYNGYLLDLDEESEIALTFVANDLQKPESVQSSYSNTFSLPDTVQNRQVFQQSHVLNSGTLIPYREADVQVISDDGRELFPFAKGELQRYSMKRFEILLTAGNLDVFNRLGEKSIRDLNLSAFNHTWSIEDIALATPNTSNYTYPLLDRGKPLDLSSINIWDLWPATFGKLIINTMMAEAGLKYTGLDTELMNRMVVPSVKKYEYEEEITKAHSMRAGLAPYREAEKRKGEYTEVVKFESTAEPTYYEGSALVFNPLDHTYNAKQAMWVSINTAVLVHIEMNSFASGALDQIAGRVDIMVNGESIANVEIKTKKQVRQIVNVSYSKYFLNAGDKVYIRYKYRELGLFTTSFSELYERGTKFGRYANYFEVIMLPEFPHGGLVEINKWLPDIKQKDFLKCCLQLHAGMMQTDQYTNTVRINAFEEVEQNTVNARDWTSKYIPETEDLSYKFGDFAQNNHFKWKEDDTVKAGYGDGLIIVDNQNLPLNADIIEFPFAATQSGGGFALPLLQNYTEQEGTDPREYDFNEVEPRLLLQGDELLNYTLAEYADSGYVEPNVTYRVMGYSKIEYNNESFNNNDTFTGVPGINEYKAFGAGYILRENVSANVTGNRCYFDGYPVNLNLQTYIIPTYYRALESILNKSKYLKLQLYLKPTDVTDFDFTRPIWLGQYQQYFYVNKINEFIINQPTEVELARL